MQVQCNQQIADHMELALESIVLSAQPQVFQNKEEGPVEAAVSERLQWPVQMVVVGTLSSAVPARITAWCQASADCVSLECVWS